jgi:hypothetical protein
MVPKAITLTLVNHSKENLQRELLQELYKPDVLEDLLKESELVVARRKEVISMVQALNKAEECVYSIFKCFRSLNGAPARFFPNQDCGGCLKRLGLRVTFVVACCSFFRHLVIFSLSFLTPLSKCEYTNNTPAGHAFLTRTLRSASVGSLTATPSSRRGFSFVCLIEGFFGVTSMKGLWTVPWRSTVVAFSRSVSVPHSSFNGGHRSFLTQKSP